jgi:hypothetical protein
MIIEWNGGSVKFTRFEPPDPTEANLDEFAGEYLSDELQATYRFRRAGDRLTLQINNLAWEELDAIAPHKFVPHRPHTYDFRLIRFRRHEQGRVDGFEIGSGRAQGIRFEKQGP